MQSQAEKRREAYLHRLKETGQLKAWDFPEERMVDIKNPHLIEDEDQYRVEGEYKGRLVSRYVKPPNC